MTKAEEKCKKIIGQYKTQKLRNTDIDGYSKYAMENAVMQAYELGRKDESDSRNQGKINNNTN